MYKVQFKTKSPFESWNSLGGGSTESQAIAMALAKKAQGAIMVRVLDKTGRVIYSS